MKNYTITVNGNVYDVSVEEKGGSAPAAVRKTAPMPEAPKAAAAPAAAPASAASGSAGSVEINAGAAGKVLKIDAPAGTSVKKGDAVVTMESMKMEIPMVAPQDGTIASINVAVGDAVEAGGLLATMN